MPNTPVATSKKETIALDLRNPLLAGVLAWLVPGLGHFYQRRYHKALIFFLCIMPIFVAGCALASGREVGIARNVYWDWRSSDWQNWRLWWAAQAPLGIAAVPSWIQAWHVNSGLAPPFGSFMAPPRLYHGDRTGVPPVLDTIWQKMPHFELGTYLAAFAGLMNLLVIFDAVGGPFVGIREEKEEKNEP